MDMRKGATLIAHCGAHKVSYADLALLPMPEKMGSRHRPFPHVEMVDMLKEEVSRWQATITREEYAIQTNGKKLFGVFDLNNLGGHPDRGYAIGFRSSNDETFALRIVAGARVFVCDNLALSGNDVVLNRKHTTGLSLQATLHHSVDQLFKQYASMDQAIARMQEHRLTDPNAKALIYDAFVKENLPLRLFPHVNEWYFESPEKIQDESATDCQPRSVWGLHNAFTRSIKVIDSPVRQFEITQAVGAYLGLRS